MDCSSKEFGFHQLGLGGFSSGPRASRAIGAGLLHFWINGKVLAGYLSDHSVSEETIKVVCNYQLSAN